MKKCTKCGLEKAYDQFVKHRRYKDGYYSRCKECTYKLEKEWRQSNPEKKNEIRTRYRHNNREKIREQDKQFYAKNSERLREKQKIDKIENPHKHKAYKEYRVALSNGKIKQTDYCQICGIKNMPLDGHHADYEKPLEVIWICKSCHMYIHKKI